MEGTEPIEIELFPNPATDVVFVGTAALFEKSVVLRLINQFGQLIWEKAVVVTNQNRERLDLTTYQNGIYFLQIKEEHKPTINKKLIINRMY